MSAVGASRNAGVERIAAAFAGSGKRAALMPYLMGGFPDVATSRAIGEAYADGGADLVELGVPFSDPLADGPVVQAAGTRALAAGTTVAGGPGGGAARAGGGDEGGGGAGGRGRFGGASAGRAHVLREHRDGPGRRGVRRRALARRRERTDRPGPAARGGGRDAHGVRGGRH